MEEDVHYSPVYDIVAEEEEDGTYIPIPSMTLIGKGNVSKNQFSEEIVDDDLSELRTIPVKEGGIDANLDCNSPVLNSNPISSGYDWKERPDAKDLTLMEFVSPTKP